MIKVCVFDMDGLLINSEAGMYAKVGMEVSRELGRPLDFSFLTEQMGGSFAAYEKNLLKRYGDDYPIKEYWEKYWEKVNYIVENVAIDLRPGVRKILNYCKDNGIRMAVASSSKRYVIEKCLRNSKIIDYFDHFVSVEDVKATKPDPEIFLKAISYFGVNVNEALVFEDGHNGAQAAINGHCRYVVVEDVALLTDEDKRKAELATDNIADAIQLIRNENETATGI